MAPTVRITATAVNTTPNPEPCSFNTTFLLCASPMGTVVYISRCTPPGNDGSAVHFTGPIQSHAPADGARWNNVSERDGRSVVPARDHQSRLTQRPMIDAGPF
jgi:hypothetical protein